MQAFFYLCLFVSLAGYMYTLWHDRTHFRRKSKLQGTKPLAIRTWLAVTEVVIPEMKIPVRVVDSGKKELVHWINIVRDTPFATYPNMNYRQLLETITPDEADKIKEAKEFLHG